MDHSRAEVTEVPPNFDASDDGQGGRNKQCNDEI
jgi:hypothetical protein